MNAGKSVFSQVTNLYPRYSFNKIVTEFKGDRNIRSFSCWDQLLSMTFAQLTYRSGLRDIEACLNAQPNRLYHMGIRGRLTRTNLANANQSRDWRIYFEFAQLLIARARRLYQDDQPFSQELDSTVYALDSTTIDLCLSMFPWAKFRKTKGAIKLHTLLDIKGSIPSFIEITDGSVHDVNILDDIALEPGSFYVMDRGYTDFERLYEIHKQLCFFVIRAKKNLKFKRLYSNPIDRASLLRSDQIGVFEGFYARKDYPEKIRRVRIYDKETDRYYVFLSNNFEIPTSLIAELYKNRWKVELFFKWIKQHLKIKHFYGTSFNAVRTQIWTAICVYVAVAILKKTCNISVSLYTILQVLSVMVFEKVPIYQLFKNRNYENTNDVNPNQLTLFD